MVNDPVDKALISGRGWWHLVGYPLIPMIINPEVDCRCVVLVEFCWEASLV